LMDDVIAHADAIRSECMRSRLKVRLCMVLID
jgi:hypothetical protein